MRTLLPTLALVLCSVLSLNAQNADLPNPAKNTITVPTGSFVIAMDKVNQANPGYFNLKAYGLIVTLQNAGVRLRWIIDSGKVKDAADITVLAERVYPSFVIAGSTPKSFKAGPFVVFPSDTTTASIIISLFNGTMATANKVNVYRTVAPVTANLRYDLAGNKPKAAILNDGGKGTIQAQYMINASVPASNYKILDSAVNLYNGCYTFASEPHNDGGGGFPITRIVDSLKDFVAKGGNFLAQCHAISTYENFNQVQSSLGITGGGTGGSLYKTTTNLIPSADVRYANPDMSFAQFDGTFVPNQTGFLQTWARFPGSVALNNFYPVISGNSAATDSIFGATVSKHKSGKGGLIFYLGNHDFSGSADEDINGQRMYLNAFLTPAAYGNCPLYDCTGPQCGPLPVRFNSFTVKKVENAQAMVNWSTATELNAKEFILERSIDGLTFVGIHKVNAKGMSNSTVNYNYKDLSPTSGYNYYRIAEVSTDGKISYSEIISVYFNERGAALDVYPSLVRGSNITVEVKNSNGTSLAIISSNGKIVMNNIKPTSSSTLLDVSKLSSGSYIIRSLEKDGTVQQKRFVITRN